MQEIIPTIERNWHASARPGRHEVVSRNVDTHPISELMPELLSADNIVFTCFTIKLCKIGELLRKSFGVEGRYFIYLHNQATILCWPFHNWGMGKYFRQDDVFVSTSSADADTFRHSFEKGRVEVVPFTVPGLKEAYRVSKSCSSVIPFIYAGRLSAQKNLHTLLYAFRLLSDREPALAWRLTVYGKDDNLGSPNMGMGSKGYGAYLKRLARQLGIGDRVEFKGYRERASLHRELARQRHVTVSAGLHSDENFGMAQFHSLYRGNLAVLTRWGGYADFGKHFGKRVLLAQVEETPRGPWVDPANFTALLGRAARAYAAGRSGGEARSGTVARLARVPAHYREGRISARLLALATERPSPGPRLRMTRLAKRILAKQAQFEKHAPGSGRIFESYSDPDAKILFRGYRMSALRSRRGPEAALRCLPWVSLKQRSILVRDPHRGDFELRAPRAGDRPSVLVTDWSGRVRKVEASAAEKLRSLGYSLPGADTRQE
jgi:glycosyltransferase involved in cell wall biosynthesis